ncbi:NAD(P)-dependent alcohol dehydrogenase [Salmonirosea aquatica]|uniref:Zinc-binding dehydrogenase n=1 Tax=Salmonirosea aquatica TaxID=2654236 RepID=A0A7C9BLN6_9BACT|nr:zinc-binding dehydrogenase [Cytophagaceae bacterium SJW1-29]
MKAAVYTLYGNPEVVQVKDVPKPTPKHNELVIKVNATTVTAGDWRMRAGNPFPIKLYNGLFKLKRTVLGHEFSGVVDSLGKNVAKFKKGDTLFGYTGANAGAHAEYVLVPANGVVAHKPGNIEDQDAAALPVGALTSLYFLRKADIKQGQNVLVYGASGSVGTYAVQLAKFFGATVTAVCSQANAELVRSLGADQAIDYGKQDFAKGPEKFDVIFDAVGKTSYAKSKKVLKPKGFYLTVGMGVSFMLQSAMNVFTRKHQLISGVAKLTKEELQFLTSLLEVGTIKPVIDRVYPLSEIRKAHQHAETGHKKGNIVILN